MRGSEEICEICEREGGRYVRRREISEREGDM